MFSSELKQIFRIRISLIFCMIFLVFISSANADKKKYDTIQPIDKGYNHYPDEYTELDENNGSDNLSDAVIINTIEKARHNYLRALSYIDREDTSGASKYFERAISILNTLVSYPGIEQNEEFTDLAQSIIDDYENFITNIDDLDENSSLFIIRDKLFQEIDKFEMEGESDIVRIKIPKDSTVEAIAGLPIEKFELTIPLDTNELVTKSLSFLTKRKVGRKFVKNCLSRSTKWLPMMKKIAKEEMVPQEIIFLSMIESALRPDAVSRAKAVGLWQFIRSTGELYGLNVPSSIWLDERRDPIKSTKAAMRHLKDLYYEFGDWHLAMAAYNCGAGCVRRAIRRSGKDNPDFWEIKNWLPRETRNYVPLYIATTQVALNPEAYGFKFDELEFKEKYEYETVTLKESVIVSELARCIGITEEELKELNPELIRDFTPPDREHYTLKIPVGSKKIFEQNYAALTAEMRRPWVYHKVRRGESLYRLSKKYGVSRREIASLNGLRSYKSRIRAGAVLKIPVLRDEEKGGSSVTSAVDGNNGDGNIVHIVRRGETLYRIAQDYGVRIKDIREWNNIPVDQDNINAGTKLVISKGRSEEKEQGQEDNQTIAKNSQPEITKIEQPIVIRHEVKRGESLSYIADLYGVTISSIKNLNRIRGSRIYPGQFLKIESTTGRKSSKNLASSTKTEKIMHKVYRGQTLSTIAARYGVRESDIKRWNPGKVHGSTIYSGTYLAIYKEQVAKGSSSTSDNVNKPPKYYKIKRGDTLISIARKFGVTVSSIKRKNKNLDERRLRVGQRIRIQ